MKSIFFIKKEKSYGVMTITARDYFLDLDFDFDLEEEYGL